MDRLDSLLEEANREPVVPRHGRDPRLGQGRPVGQEEGEPPLAATPLTATPLNGLRRRLLQRQQARERRLKFARELVASGFDGEKALIAAGYSVVSKAVSTTLHALQSHPEVISEVNRLRAVLEQQADVAAIDLAQEWVQIATSNVFDYFNESEAGDLTLKSKADIPKKAQRAVKSLKIKRRRTTDEEGKVTEHEDIELTLWDKQAALNSLAEIQGLYKRDTDEAKLDSLAQKIAERTERHRKLMNGTTIEGKVVHKGG